MRKQFQGTCVSNTTEWYNLIIPEGEAVVSMVTGNDGWIAIFPPVERF